ncbi:MAG: CDP-diacylglycerol--serine O-phosphatidyltransferase, partial [Bacteroidetes bacterium]|nr:CDP-diacylglycerol--serine O-phosphatidyltransferase [Bacteroidota bacterium]
MKRHIPNLITLLNLASGFTAVIFIMHGDILTASWVLVAALFFDFADGLAARLLKAWSELGKELDSLADVVSFGVAPGLLVYTLAGDSAPQWARILLSAMLPVLAALRLAKFNTDPDQKDSFVGLPSPAAAIAIITLVLSMAHSGKGTPDLVAGNQIALF